MDAFEVSHTLSSFDPMPLTQSFTPLEPAPRTNDEDNPAHELDCNPRYLVLRNFHSEFLPDDRDIEVYLPEAYLTEPERRFPVFYLHDGQNLFDGRTSYVTDHTWRAHSTADRLTRERVIEPVILVGVNNTGLRRMAEYTPTRDPRLRGGDGDRYGRLLTEELKPLIDAQFRTLADAPNTGIGGSSLGGLISLYIAINCPEIFGKIAVISPSIWWDSRSILRALPGSPGHRPHLRIWLDMGTAEGMHHLRDTDQLYRRLLQLGWREGIDLKYQRVTGGLHNEDAWAGRFDQVLQFLFPARSAEQLAFASDT
ncbi:MAG TPA: alpha/beta hydrolase-fold protein [Acidobacteriaceae bacterium]|nr:alpha/beta hydrolase-fold protein [Acidobacteriaceae bacterium]